MVGGLHRNTVTGVGPIESELNGRLGVFLGVPLARVMAVRPELAVTWKGFGVEVFPLPLDFCPPPECTPVPPYREETTLTYLEAPLLVQAVSPWKVADRITPSLYTGPFFAIRLNCAYRQQVQAIPEQLALYAPVTTCDGSGSVFNNGDAGLVLGGAIRYGPAGLGLRWTRSLVALSPREGSLGRFSGGKSSTVDLVLELVVGLPR
jgi:hypothetical protein